MFSGWLPKRSRCAHGKDRQRRHEEVIEGEKGDQRGKDCRVAATCARQGEYHQQIHDGDVGNARVELEQVRVKRRSGFPANYSGNAQELDDDGGICLLLPACPVRRWIFFQSLSDVLRKTL